MLLYGRNPTTTNTTTWPTTNVNSRPLLQDFGSSGGAGAEDIARVVRRVAEDINLWVRGEIKFKCF